MGKKKKVKKKTTAGGGMKAAAAVDSPVPAGQPPVPADDLPPEMPTAADPSRQPAAELLAESAAAPEAPPQQASAAAPAARSMADKIGCDIRVGSRLRRMLPDLIRVLLAFGVIAVGAAIWWKPPLLSASFPVTTFRYRNGPARAAALYRPVAMPERYYVRLPEKLENRYEWFAIDRRREVVALTEEPQHRFLGKTAVKRGEELGLDLEFRDIDGHEWLIYFYADAIVFSNNLLSISLDTKKKESD